MLNNLNHICFYGGGVGIDLSKLQDKMKTSLNQFIELLVKFRDANPGSGECPVLIENVDAPGCLDEMSYFQPNGIERIVTFDGDICGVAVGAGEV